MANDEVAFVQEDNYSIVHTLTLNGEAKERMRTWVRFQTGKSPSAVGRALSHLVAEAIRHVPHYRNAFSALAGDRTDSIEALGKLPPTSRKRLAIPPHTRFLREDAKENKLHVSQTSGSTGSPATLFFSKAELNFRRILLFRAIRARFPQCLPIRITDVGQVTAQEMPHLTHRLGPFRLTRVPGNLPMSEQVRLYSHSAPQLLEGYAGCLELLAHELLKTGNPYPRPQWLISRGEALTPTVREMLEQVFDCPVANFYNSEEVGNMAWDCPHRADVFHVNTDACILELLDEHNMAVQPGVEGRVVLTNLYNYTMPFIRYDLGDYATWDNPNPHPCSCGAVTPTLASIDGRSDDFIILPDSRRLSPLVVLTTVAQQLYGQAHVSSYETQVPQVRQFQVVQEQMGEAHVYVVAHKSLPSGLDDRIRRRFQQLHPDFQTHLSMVQAIPLDSSGKLKRIISLVNP